MAWQNVFEYDPGATVNVFRYGFLVDPVDYASFGIAVAIINNVVQLTYPDNPTEPSGVWAALVMLSAETSLPTRILNPDADPWPTVELEGMPQSISTTDPLGQSYQPENFLGVVPGVTMNILANPITGLGVQIGYGGF